MSGRSPAHPPQAPARTSLAGAAWMESLYDDWRRDPGSVPEPWRWFFQGFELAGRAPEPPASPAAGDGRVSRLVEAWRGLGHWIADTDPLSAPRPVPPALALPAFGLSEDDLDLVFDSGGFAGLPRAPLRDLLAALRETYCGPVGVELLHLQDPAARRWLQETLEEGRG
ncbi:MAG: 2-oxoglutarate dehydrogenase E1 component, partial [Deltaproteobacteria bacterium]|nr:2-oxoglutarate dehydrogenase E1 component [Deltaproteobacteria bacterium]